MRPLPQRKFAPTVSAHAQLLDQRARHEVVCGHFAGLVVEGQHEAVVHGAGKRQQLQPVLQAHQQLGRGFGP
jgi:hypothetical protein